MWPSCKHVAHTEPLAKAVILDIHVEQKKWSCQRAWRQLDEEGGNRDGIAQQEESSTEGLWRRVNVTHMRWARNGQTAKTLPHLSSQDPVKQNPVSPLCWICQESRTIQNRSGLERSINGSWLISSNGGRKTEFKDIGLRSCREESLNALNELVHLSTNSKGVTNLMWTGGGLQK